MIIKERIYVHDIYGTGQSGKTVVYYPYGTTSNGRQATDLGGGNYEVLIDSSLHPDSIAKFYDVYVDLDLKYPKRLVGLWEWVVKDLTIPDAVTNFTFASLLDSEGNSLPAIVNNAGVAIENYQTDRLVILGAITTSGFGASLSRAGHGSVGTVDIRVYLTK